jgi:uncharacterized protein (DUF302 family)
MAIDGLHSVPSRFEYAETFNRVLAEIKARGLTVFATIDHAAGAATVGLMLRPTHLLIFGHAKGGTPLMQQDQTMGIELPLKVLIWQDTAGQTWLSHSDLTSVVRRHPLMSGRTADLSKLDTVVSAIVDMAAS